MKFLHDAGFPLFIIVSMMVFYIWLYFKGRQKGKVKLFNRQLDSRFNNLQENEIITTSSDDSMFSNHRDNGCYGINPSTGLPLSSSGYDIAGNPLGSSISSFSTNPSTGLSMSASNNDPLVHS